MEFDLGFSDKEITAWGGMQVDLSDDESTP